MSDIALTKKSRPDIGQIVLFIAFFGAVGLFLSMRMQVTFWPYVAASYCLGIIVYYWERGHNSGAADSLFNYLFPKQVWLHRSAISDGLIGLILYFAFIRLADFYHPLTTARYLISTFFPDALADKVETYPRIVRDMYGMPHMIAMHMLPNPSWPLVILFITGMIVVTDFFYYFAHRWTHTVPTLWEFHKIHHSAEVMTPLTVQRFHPLDAWFTYGIRIFGLTLFDCVYIYFYPGLHNIVTLATINIGVFLTDFVAANLRHSHIWLRFGKPLEHVLVSPAVHQIHHSIDPKHLNKNFGSFFSLWDWMFGSLYIPESREHITFGLGSPEANAPYHTIKGMIFEPFRQFFKKRGPSPTEALAAIPKNKAV